jgi:hypothetical protein
MQLPHEFHVVGILLAVLDDELTSHLSGWRERRLCRAESEFGYYVGSERGHVMQISADR